MISLTPNTKYQVSSQVHHENIILKKALCTYLIHSNLLYEIDIVKHPI